MYGFEFSLNVYLTSCNFRVGEHNLMSDYETQLTRTVAVSNIITHREYHQDIHGAQVNDISLLYLENHLDLTQYIPACIAQSSDNFVGQMATVAGWGQLEYGGEKSDVLMEVQVRVVANDVCNHYGITDAMLCAGEEKGEDSCRVSAIITIKLSSVVSSFEIITNIESSIATPTQGDSGGPLIVEHEGQSVLIGVVSWSEGCGDKVCNSELNESFRVTTFN